MTEYTKIRLKTDSLDEAGLAPYATLRRQVEHCRSGIFVAEGEKVVRRLLVSGLTVRSMLMTDEWYDRLFGAPAEFSRSADFRIYIATKALVENVVGFNLHQGLMAVAECPPEPSLDELVNRSNGRAAEGLYVALDGLVNSENVGVVVRNAAAFEVDGIICGESSSSPYLRRAVRTSMGAVFSMSVFHPPSLGELLTRLREGSGMRVLAADASAGSSAWETDLRGRLCIVLGNEREGISPAIREVCDGAVAIPMGGGTDSLNVGSASAALLSEIRRQRTSR